MTRSGLLFLFTLVACCASLSAQTQRLGRNRPASDELSVALVPSAPSPAVAGTVVSWQASVQNQDRGPVWYRFRVRRLGGEFQTIRDFGPLAALDWMAHEGFYEMEVTAREPQTGRSSTGTFLFQGTSRVTDGTPVVSPTSHPLVFLYSAPPCEAGSRMKVQFSSGGGTSQSTPWQECLPGISLDFLLGGMTPNTTYAGQQLTGGDAGWTPGPVLTFTTGEAALDVSTGTVLDREEGSRESGVVLLAGLGRSIATDLQGNVIWYHCCLTYLTQPAGGGRFLGIDVVVGGSHSDQVVREFDLLGLTMRETNAAAINEQLAAKGLAQMGGFHHEARLLDNGKLLVMASTERILSGVQSEGPVNILGDMLLVLDRNLQVEWAWDSFDHLDVQRAALLNERCEGCSALFLGSREETNDWVHGNAVARTPDGNLIYSARHQDWLIKIDYRDGVGSGQVLWRLGKDGDFQFDSTDPYPWFSHQHDGEFEAGNGLLTVYDNGNLRALQTPGSHSRGQVLQLDEQNRVAHLVVNADLGDYSFALGSAQRLPNGNYHFDNGWLLVEGGPARSEAVEVDASGRVVYRMEVPEAVYRSFRLPDIYGQP